MYVEINYTGSLDNLILKEVKKKKALHGKVLVFEAYPNTSLANDRLGNYDRIGSINGFNYSINY